MVVQMPMHFYNGATSQMFLYSAKDVEIANDLLHLGEKDRAILVKRLIFYLLDTLVNNKTSY